MKESLIHLLVCPETGSDLQLTGSAQREGEEILDGSLVSAEGIQYPIRNGIPRFVVDDDYVSNFSFEWWRHRQTQLDRFSGLSISTDKFQSQLNFPLSELRGKRILDVGCGSGRFMDVALKAGAEVIGIDLSYAVDAACKNLKSEPGAHFIQASVFRLPFRPETFDFIFSFGVLHHTPDCQKAFSLLPPLLKPSGHVAVCLYSSYERALVLPGNLWRGWLNRWPAKLLYALCHLSVPLYYLYKIPVIGRLGNMLWTISMHPNWRWRILDTYDWYSPRYQSAHTHHEVFQWFKAAGLEGIEVLEPGISLIGQKGTGVASPKQKRQAQEAIQ
jgi:SAM-dependent methyltransferase